ncbi:MAG: gliding motility-associated protein GldE [Bacteroidales bacterium]|nr:gliding motility-associated protein GldE [Bacteroidales bacterium]MDY0253050.1 gliding motility-associated protein GldE [Tenuifilaceae bacterium]
MEPGEHLIANTIFLADISFHPITWGIVFGIVVLLILLVLSSLVSGSESAFFSLSPVNLKYLEDNPTKTNAVILRLLAEPEQLLASILIANNFINVGIVILSAFITNATIDFSHSPIIGFVVQVVVITFILLLFGEIIPKILATSKALSFARFMAFPLFVITKVFKPFNYLLVSSTAQMNKRFSQKRNISIDELSDALEITSGHHPEEKKILEGIVTFGHTEVREIMKPRLDVVALDISTGFNKLKSVVVESGYSRIPVYEHSFDEIRGVLYVKDMLPHIDEPDDFNWQALLREPYFIPESKKINVLLSEFQANRIHLAIVVDEYGGTCGIVSLEDILEEIVGEISDESDEEVSLYTKIDDNNYLFEGKILLNDFAKVLNVNDSIFDDVRGEAETLAGVILEMVGHLPNKNDTIKHKYFKFTIDSVDNKRIRRIKVTLAMQSEKNEK